VPSIAKEATACEQATAEEATKALAADVSTIAKMNENEGRGVKRNQYFSTK
jgi:hypothetical protein